MRELTAAPHKKKRVVSPIRTAPMDYTFLVLVLVILTIGLIMLFSASYAYAYYYMNQNSFHFISRQLVFAVMGVAAMIVISFIDYRILRKFAWPLYGLALVLLVIVLFLPEINYVHRWINLGFTTFQPSELAKLALVVLYAHLITQNYDKMKTFRYGIVPFAVILGSFALLLVLEPHLSATVLLCCIAAVMLIAGGINMKWFTLAGASAVGLLAVVALIPGVIPYAASRLSYWLDPFSDPLGKGFQTIQSLYAIGSGGVMGAGIGQSRQKYLYLPEPHNDFIFAVVCEELGFVGATCIIILFALLVWRGFHIAMKCKDRFGCMLALGLITQVGVQVILNIAVVTNTIPNTGISLPFFSYGGTALVMLLAQMGVILSVSRQSSVEKE